MLPSCATRHEPVLRGGPDARTILRATDAESAWADGRSLTGPGAAVRYALENTSQSALAGALS